MFCACWPLFSWYRRNTNLAERVAGAQALCTFRHKTSWISASITLDKNFCSSLELAASFSQLWYIKPHQITHLRWLILPARLMPRHTEQQPITFSILRIFIASRWLSWETFSAFNYSFQPRMRQNCSSWCGHLLLKWELSLAIIITWKSKCIYAQTSFCHNFIIILTS